MKIALFDYFIDESNAIGKFHAMILKQVASEHEFTVYSVNCRDDLLPLVNWRKVWVPFKRPMFLLFVFYRINARILYGIDRLLRRCTYDEVQSVESYTGLPGINYAHFCHRYFLNQYWGEISRGQSFLKRLPRWLDHWLRACCESYDYRKARQVVVPSQGLRRELESLYPTVKGKVMVLPNPINIERMRRPENFESEPLREKFCLSAHDTVFCFTALGHFERKGLPLLLDALVRLDAKLWVVGGTPSIIAHYRSVVVEIGLEDRVVFAGMQDDVRPFLWASDAFVLPSYYEVFPTVALEASAAGLPLLSTPLNGVEEYVKDGENGLLMERSISGIAQSMQQFLAMTLDQRAQMAAKGVESVRCYSHEAFIENWQTFYRNLGTL